MSDRPLVFRYHPLMHVAAWGLSLFALAALCVPLFVIPAKEVEARLGVGLLCAAIAGLSLPLVWEASRWRLTVSDAGLECRSPWRGTWAIAWEDVRRLDWDPVAMWFVVVPRGGRWFRFSYAIGGRDRLLATFERKLSAEQLTGAVTGYTYVGRAFPGRRALPAMTSVPATPAGPRRPIPGIDLSKWGGGRGGRRSP